jgi:hypothetical protein
MKNPKLTWWNGLMVKLLQKETIAGANIIVQEAFKGYSIKKQRSDKGKRKGGEDERRAEGI